MIWNAYFVILFDKATNIVTYKSCDLVSVLNIIKLLNKIEQEKCDLEIIVTSNLRLKECLSHNFVLDIFVTFAYD